MSAKPIDRHRSSPPKWRWLSRRARSSSLSSDGRDRLLAPFEPAGHDLGPVLALEVRHAGRHQELEHAGTHSGSHRAPPLA